MRARPRRRADPAHGHATAVRGPSQPPGMIPCRARGYREASLDTRVTPTTATAPGHAAAPPGASHPRRSVAPCRRPWGSQAPCRRPWGSQAPCPRPRGNQATDTSARWRPRKRMARGGDGRLRTARPQTADGWTPIAGPGLRQGAGRRPVPGRRRTGAGGPRPGRVPAPGRLTDRPAGRARTRRGRAARCGQATAPGGRARSLAATAVAGATPGGRPPNPRRRAPGPGGPGQTGRHNRPLPGGRSTTRDHRRPPLDGAARVRAHSRLAPDGRPRGPEPAAPRPPALARAAMPHRSDRRETTAGWVPGARRPVPRPDPAGPATPSWPERPRRRAGLAGRVVARPTPERVAARHRASFRDQPPPGTWPPAPGQRAPARPAAATRIPAAPTSGLPAPAPQAPVPQAPAPASAARAPAPASAARAPAPRGARTPAAAPRA